MSHAMQWIFAFKLRNLRKFFKPKYKIEFLPLADDIDAKGFVRCVIMLYFLSEVLSLSTK